MKLRTGRREAWTGGWKMEERMQKRINRKIVLQGKEGTYILYY
jgi:hypothetical protein